MSTEGLPVSNVVGTNIELGPRSTTDAANAASSSQAADSAAASADRAWKFSNDAAASAAAAKADAATASAAVSDTLNKITTTAQTVASSVTIKGGLISYGDHIMQANASAPNVLIRLRDSSGIEQGAVYSQTDTGQMNIRWGGAKYQANFKPDGSVTFPGDIYAGSTKVATRSTALGAKDLNTLFDDQSTSANATTDRHYPVALAGILKILVSRASVGSEIYATQQYYPYNSGTYYYQRTYNAGSATWPDWEIFESRSKNDMRYLQFGAYGVGKVNNSTTFDFTQIGTGAGFYKGIESQLGAPTGASLMAGASVSVSSAGSYTGHIYTAHGATPGAIKLYAGWLRPDGSITWVSAWHSGNTTVDANGFVKKASAIVKLFGDGSCELNDQSQGVTTEHIETGVYRISGVLGFNSDDAWGGAGNGIEIPVDDNKRALVWIESKILLDGDIEIRTYHRTYDTGPYSTRNIKCMDSGEVYKKNPIYVMMPDGTPIDIPAGRWIDLRVEMPAGDEPELVIEPEPIPDPEVAPDTDQQPEVETE